MLERNDFFMDGVYVGSVDTPLGRVNGKVSLKSTSNGSMNACLEVMGMKNVFEGGKVNGNRCIFQGEMMGTRYVVEGTVIGDNLQIFAKTGKGDYKIQARRV